MANLSIPTMRERVQQTMSAGGRAVLGTSLALMLCASQMAAPTPALAYESASFTISAKDNQGAVYRVYRLFSADMTANTGADPDFPESQRPIARWPGIATHMSWNDEAKDAVLAFLDSYRGDSGTYRDWIAGEYDVEPGSDEHARLHGIPQNAAEYIAEMVGASPDDPGAAHVPTAKAERSFALELARALAASGVSAQRCTADAQGKATFTGEEGYYLFITDDASVGANEAGTSPIWVPLGGATATLEEKSAVPTLDKQVREDSTGTFGKVADANAGQDLDYRLVATMPENIGAFDTYFLKFSDQLPADMDLAGGNTSSVKVTLRYTHDGNAYSPDITTNSHVSMGYTRDGKLTVAIDDLKSVYSALAKDATVTVDYRAHLKDGCVIGAQGNLNSAVLTYAANPATAQAGAGSWDAPDPDGTSSTLEGAHRTRTCTWKVELEKVDKQTQARLPGARFTVRVAQTSGSADTASVGKYVQGDGSLGEAPHEFATGRDGKFEIPRVDSGTYTIRETAAPAGYELQDADISLDILPAPDQAAGSIPRWQLSLSGGEGAKANGTDIVTHLVAADGDAVASALETGTVAIQTSDDKKTVMPITGMEGTSAATLLACGVLAASLAGLHRIRRREEDGEAR